MYLLAKVYLKNSISKCPLCQHTLKEKWVKIQAIDKRFGFNNRIDYFIIKAHLCITCEMGFLNSRGMEEYLTEYTGSFDINIDKTFYREEAAENKKLEVKASQKIKLNDQSKLGKLGYSVSAEYTRGQRWDILVRAKQKISPQEMIKIINTNISMRLKQKNGHVKYERAIKEWEYDIQCIKQKLMVKN